MTARRPGPDARLRLRLLGVGAMASPRYAPAGLLVHGPTGSVMLDGGPGSAPGERLAAWLVTDLHAELIAEIRRAARERGLEPRVGEVSADGLLRTGHEAPT